MAEGWHTTSCAQRSNRPLLARSCASPHVRCRCCRERAQDAGARAAPEQGQDHLHQPEGAVVRWRLRCCSLVACRAPACARVVLLLALLLLSASAAPHHRDARLPHTHFHTCSDEILQPGVPHSLRLQGILIGACVACWCAAAEFPCTRGLAVGAGGGALPQAAGGTQTPAARAPACPACRWAGHRVQQAAVLPAGWVALVLFATVP
jgi:hypothetical protein